MLFITKGCILLQKDKVFIIIKAIDRHPYQIAEESNIKNLKKTMFYCF